MRSLHRLLRLPGYRRQLLYRALFLIVVVRLALWVLPYRWIRSLMLDVPARLHAGSVQADARSVARAVQSVSRYVPKATCLTQAIATRLILSRLGYPSQLRLGVARNPQTGLFDAHAWVDVDGRTIIGGSVSERYIPFPTPDGIFG